MRFFSRARKKWKTLKHIVGGKAIQAASRAVRVNERPIFVLGNQKAGTTVIAALLAERIGASVTLDFRTPSASALQAVHAGKQSLTDFIEDRAWYFSREIVKEPGLTFLYEELALLFPRAPFAVVVRDPRDNIRSLLNRVGLSGCREQLSRRELDEVSPIWTNIIKGKELGDDGANYIEILATRWNRAAEVSLENERPCLIRYEDFVSNKEEEITRMAERLGCTPRHDISKKKDVQYQSQGNRDIAWDEFYSAENLARIEQICGKNMASLGYRLVQ